MGDISSAFALARQALKAPKHYVGRVPSTPMQVAQLRQVVARNLRVLMDARSLSQTALAKMSGVNQSHISVLLKGKKAASLDTLEQLADALTVPVWALTWPGLPDAQPECVAQLFELYMRASVEGRAYILATAKREQARPQA